MKYLKIMLFALIMAFTFAGAQAQVVVRLGGHPYHHHYYHHRHWHHYHRY